MPTVTDARDFAGNGAVFGRRGRMIAVGIAVAIAVAGLAWAKWVPYTGKIVSLGAGSPWPGGDILRTGGVQPGDAPSWSAAWSFTRAYGVSIWHALLVALLVSAAVQTLLPPSWLPNLLNRRGRVRDAVAGGLAGTPSMMCTCCTAPVATTLRRNGASTSASVAYWLGNPLLNPAVLVFLAILAPWQWTVTRLLVGAVVVIAGAALVARFAEWRTDAQAVAAVPTAPCEYAPTLGRFLRAVGWLILTLVPEYLIVVMLLGAFRGWLLPLLDGGHTGPLVAVVAAVIGTLVVIPTAGEIPILLALASIGLAAGPIGALLLTLPAVSLPGAAMVIRTFGARATIATACVAAAGGLLAATILSIL